MGGGYQALPQSRGMHSLAYSCVVLDSSLQ